MYFGCTTLNRDLDAIFRVQEPWCHVSRCVFQECISEKSEAAARPGTSIAQSTVSTQSGVKSSGENARERYQYHALFVSTPACKVTPHTAHLVEILPGISLIVVCEVSFLRLSLTDPGGGQAGAFTTWSKNERVCQR